MTMRDQISNLKLLMPTQSLKKVTQELANGNKYGKERLGKVYGKLSIWEGKALYDIRTACRDTKLHHETF